MLAAATEWGRLRSLLSVVTLLAHSNLHVHLCAATSGAPHSLSASEQCLPSSSLLYELSVCCGAGAWAVEPGGALRNGLRIVAAPAVKPEDPGVFVPTSDPAPQTSGAAQVASGAGATSAPGSPRRALVAARPGNWVYTAAAKHILCRQLGRRAADVPNRSCKQRCGRRCCCAAALVHGGM